MYNTSNNKFLLSNANGGDNVEILEIKYTVTNEEGNAEIKINDIEVANIDYEEEEIGTISKQIKIEKVQDIPTVEESTLTSISITKNPTKTEYKVGENFDKTGIEVTATYADGSTKAVTGYKVESGEELKEGQTEVTISYTENGVTKTAKISIKVTKVEEKPQQQEEPKKEENNNNVNETNGQRLPQTGISDNIIIAIVIVAIMAVVAYIKFKKYKNI